MSRHAMRDKGEGLGPHRQRRRHMMTASEYAKAALQVEHAGPFSHPSSVCPKLSVSVG
jgi:hypothetical protein